MQENMPDSLETPTLTAEQFRRRKRARNMAILATLVFLSVLFYAITILKMA